MSGMFYGGEVLRDSRQVADYAGLRATSGPEESIVVTGYFVGSSPTPEAGLFVRAPGTVGADNGGTRIVRGDGVPFERVFDGEVLAKWFGVSTVATDAANTAAAHAAQVVVVARGGGTVEFPPGLLPMTNIVGASRVCWAGAGRQATTLISNTAGAIFTWTDKSDFSFRRMTVGGVSASHALRIIASTTYVMRPEFEDFGVSGVGAAGVCLSFECDSVHPIYFPSIVRPWLSGGSAAPNVGTRKGIVFGGAGSTWTVGPYMEDGRITNVQRGIVHDKVDTCRSDGMSFDGILDGAGGGIALEFLSGTGYNHHKNVRMEAPPAIDVLINFRAGSADNIVEGILGSPTTAQVIDAGTRNSWQGSDGSAGSVNKLGAPLQGIRFSAIPQSVSDPHTLDDYTEGDWTPSDDSSAVLSIVFTCKQFIKIGRLVTFSVDMTYPVTADTTPAKIKGLPYPAMASDNSVFGGAPSLSTVGSAVSWLIGSNTSGIQFFNQSAQTIKNNDLSGKTLRLSGSYFAAS